MERTGPSSRTLLKAALLVLLALGLRLHDLTSKPMWADETSSLVFAKGHVTGPVEDARPADLGQRMELAGLSEVWEVHKSKHPPVYGLLLHLWMRTTGSADDLPLKLLSALLGALAVLAAAWASRELHGEAAGLWAGLLAALSPFLVEYSQEVNHYALACALTAWAYLWYYRLLRSRSVGDALAFTAVATLGLYSHYYVGLALAAMGLGLLPHLWRGPRRALLVLPFAGVLALFAPYLPAVRSQLVELVADSNAGAFGGWDLFLLRLRINPLFSLLGERAEITPPAVAALLCLLLLALLALGLRAEQDRDLRITLAVNALLPLALVFTAYWVQQKNTVLWPRYGQFFVFALLVPVALLLSRLRPFPRSLAAATLLLPMLVGLEYYYRDFLKEDWRGAAAEVAASPGAEPVLIFKPNLGSHLAQYLPGSGHRITSLGYEAGALPAVVERVTRGAPGVWVVSAWAGGLATPSLAEDLLACRYPLREEFDRYLVRLVRYRNGPPGTPLPQACAAPPRLDPEACVVEQASPRAEVTGLLGLRRADAAVSLLAGGRDLGSARVTLSAQGARFAVTVDLSGERPGVDLPLSVRVRVPGENEVLVSAPRGCLLRPSVSARPAPGPAEERLVLEEVTPLEGGHLLRLRGWAISSLGVQALRVSLDGAERLRTRRHGLARGDVAAAFPGAGDAALYSGFSLLVDSAGLEPGEHRVLVEVLRPDGSVAAPGTPRSFTTAAR